MNITALKKLDHSLSLVSTVNGGKQYGCIANSLHQITSATPQKFSISLSASSATCKALQESKILSVTLLAADCSEEIINEFGYKSGRMIDKFAAFPPALDAQGCPYLEQGMIGRASLKVVETVAVGTHILFICELLDADTFSDKAILTIHGLDTRGKDIPPEAPIIRQLDANAGWKCTVCGYVRLDDDIPDDFICPICRAPRSKFEKR